MAVQDSTMEDSSKGEEEKSILPGVSPVSEREEAEEMRVEKDTNEESATSNDVSLVDREYKQRITMYTMGESISDAQSTIQRTSQTGQGFLPDESYKSRIAMYTTAGTPGVESVGGNGEIEIKRDIIASHSASVNLRAQRRNLDPHNESFDWREESTESTCVGVPEPVGLQRLPNARNQNRVTEPGAYPHRPGAALDPLADMEGDFQIGDPDQANRAGAPETPAEPTIEDGLVEAEIVQEEENPDLEEARPVDLEGLEQDRNKKGKKRTVKLLIGMATILVVLVALVCGLTIGLRSKQDTYSPQTIQPPTPAPSVEVLPSGEPGVLDDLMKALPNHSLEKLYDPASDQSKAIHWLLNHRNITRLPEWRKVQLFALSTFYYAFDGPNWPFGLSEDWLDDTRSECTWHSSNYGGWGGTGSEIVYNDFSHTNRSEVCNKRGEFEILHSSGGEDYIIERELSMPLEIALLTSLKTINIRGHEFVNQSFPRIFPEKLAPLMTNLRTLKLNGNKMNGLVGIPTEYGLMTSLRVLNLSNNNIHGTLPSELGLLTNLKNLALTGNHFTGKIPTELCHSNLTGIAARDNALSGHIPSEFGLMASLQQLRFQNNLFSGTIPSELGLMTNLRRITLGGNSMSGSTPSEIGSLTALQLLQLKGNPLTGSMPTQLGLLTDMVDLQLSNTQFSGLLPTELGRLALSNNLGNVNVAKTDLTGTIPNEICFLESESCKYIDPFATGKREGKKERCGLLFDCNATLCGCNCACSQLV